MSFWNDPQNNSIKALLAVVVLIGIGAFAYQARNVGETGRVINTGMQGTSMGVMGNTSGRPMDSTMVGGITLNQGTPAPANKVCKAGDYQGSGGGCFHVKSDCSYTYDDKACPTNFGTSASGSINVNTQPNTPNPAAVKCVPGNYRTAGGDCVSVDSECRSKPSTGCPTPTSTSTGTAK